jgi:3'(2'),5'-bisphosphate nucleotidase
MTAAGRVPVGEPLLAEAEAIAVRAGKVILGHYQGVIAQRAKADASPVTVADEAAEAVIVPALRALTPDIPIVSEEAVAAGHIPEVHGPGNSSNRFWLVDPLDGTKEFISRNGEFTVNIALIEDGRPLLGVVHVPALATTYGGVVPGIARRRRDGVMGAINARKPPGDGVIVLSSCRMEMPWQWMRSEAERVGGHRTAGSAQPCLSWKAARSLSAAGPYHGMGHCRRPCGRRSSGRTSHDARWRRTDLWQTGIRESALCGARSRGMSAALFCHFLLQRA